jgi:hypothetical protein
MLHVILLHINFQMKPLQNKKKMNQDIIVNK